MRQLFQKVLSWARGKDPLPALARLLGVDEEEVARLGSLASADAMELFGSLIERKHGGFIDWRATPEDIYDILLPCLSPAEREFLPAAPESIEAAPALDVLKDLALCLDMAPRVLRILEIGTDEYLVLLVPRDHARQFDSMLRSSRQMRLA